jgi:hypothetical protein
MKRFLVSSPHDAGECNTALKQVYAMGYLTHFYWGCKVGEHCGWMILEAENAQEALMVVPTFLRSKAHAIELHQFSPREVKVLH